MISFLKYKKEDQKIDSEKERQKNQLATSIFLSDIEHSIKKNLNKFEKELKNNEL